MEKWTREEENLLAKLAKDNVDTTIIAKKLGKSESSIYNKASELGITLKPKDKNK